MAISPWRRGTCFRRSPADPNDPELLVQTFLACLNAGRPETVQLARRLPTNQVAQMLIADAAAATGD